MAVRLQISLTCRQNRRGSLKVGCFKLPEKRGDLLGTVACVPKNTRLIKTILGRKVSLKNAIRTLITQNHYYSLDFSLGVFLRGEFQQSGGSGGEADVGSGGEAEPAARCVLHLSGGIFCAAAKCRCIERVT